MKRTELRFINFKVFIAAFFIGCFVAFGQAPWSFFPVSIVGLIGLFALTTYFKSHSIEKIIFIFGFGYFSLTLHWVVQPFLVETKYYGWLAPFGFLTLVTLCSSFWTITTYFVLSLSRSSLSLSIAFSLTLGEFIRSYAFSGFPWGLVGYIWLDTPLAQLAGWIGPLGLTGFTFLIAGIPFSINNSFRVLPTFSVIFLVSIIIAVLRMDNIEQSSSKKVVRLVQPNAVQKKKWDPNFAPIYFKKLLSFSSEKSNQNLDLVVWPETAIVPWLDDASKELATISESIPLGADLIFGIRRHEKNKIFNSLILLSNDGVVKEKYDKYHLVPFGEYIPVLRFLSDHNILFQNNYDTFGFSSGSGAKILSSKIGLIRPLICYEAIFFQEINNNPRPNFLVNLTNDGWLGSWAGPKQHLQQVRMRAIEQGLPVIRSANTGISAVIDPYGKVIESIPLDSDGYVDVNLPSRLNETLYSKLGETLFLISLFFWCLILLVLEKRIRLDGVDSSS